MLILCVVVFRDYYLGRDIGVKVGVKFENGGWGIEVKEEELCLGRVIDRFYLVFDFIFGSICLYF